MIETSRETNGDEGGLRNVCKFYVTGILIAVIILLNAADVTDTDSARTGTEEQVVILQLWFVSSIQWHWQNDVVEELEFN